MDSRGRERKEGDIRKRTKKNIVNRKAMIEVIKPSILTVPRINGQ